MRAVWLPLVEDERKQLPDHAAPVQGVPAVAEGGARGPSLMTALGLGEPAVIHLGPSAILRESVVETHVSGGALRLSRHSGDSEG